MNGLEKYNIITSDLEDIKLEIATLEKDETVKRYLQLKKDIIKLQNKKVKIYKEMKYQEYDKCNHILIYSKIENDPHESRTYKYRGCVKCGLDESVLDADYTLSFDEQIIYDYLISKGIRYMRGIKVEVVNNLDEAQKYYQLLKTNNPDINDEEFVRYFEAYINEKSQRGKVKEK